MNDARSMGFATSALAAMIYTVAPAPADAAEGCYHPRGNLPFGVYGDVNASGAVNVADALCGIMSVLTAQSATPVSEWPACVKVPEALLDLDCDGVVTVADVVLIARRAHGHGLAPEVPIDAQGCPESCAPCAPPGEPTCHIQGVCVPDGAAIAAQSCLRCESDVSLDQAQSAPDGAACDPGWSCEAGECLQDEALGHAQWSNASRLFVITSGLYAETIDLRARSTITCGIRPPLHPLQRPVRTSEGQRPCLRFARTTGGGTSTPSVHASYC